MVLLFVFPVLPVDERQGGVVPLLEVLDVPCCAKHSVPPGNGKKRVGNFNKMDLIICINISGCVMFAVCVSVSMCTCLGCVRNQDSHNT